MLNSLAIRLLWRSFNWLTRLTIVIAATIAVLIALTIIALRHYVLPDIEQYHDKITASLTSAIGNTITIGKIEGDWQGLQPRLKFTDIRVLDERQQPAFELPDISGSVSWMSLFSAELRLASLEIVRPELLVLRDAKGHFFINGIALSKHGGEPNLADWLLHQSHMAVRDALIVWVDERRAAPPLVLQQVNLRIESFFSRHRFALRALPPEELATPLDVRGDMQGSSFDELSDWRGQIFTQLDYTDVMAWRPWLDLPGEFSRGRGALRGWLGIKDGKVSQIAADLDLRDVVTKLAKDLPELAMLELRGRATWQADEYSLEISTRQFSMRMQNGVRLLPTDFYLFTERDGNGQLTGGELRANQLELETLSGLAKYLPLETGMRTRLDEYAPNGKLSSLYVRWQGVPENPDSYNIKGHFENFGLHQVGKMPGFSGLTMDVDGGDAGGRMSFNSRQLKVDAPDVMREPLTFATLTGQAGWQHKRGEWSVKVDNISVANQDLAGNLYGNYQTIAGTRGVLDLTAKLTRGDIRSAARYTPLFALHRKGNDWLNGALLAGHTEDLRIRIKGNLSDFPLDGTEDVLFKIGGHARDAVIEFGKDWPKIENITGEFLINGNRLEVNSTSATMLGARLQNLSATLPDMMSEDLPLEIRGEAQAASKVFLQFIQQSPVRGYIDGVTDRISASGSGHLALFVRIPLLGGKPVQVSGNIRVQDNDIDLGEGVPWLRNTRGVLSFTESGIQASGLSAEILGGPATISMQTVNTGTVHATVQGRSDLDVLREKEPHPMLNHLHGGAEWGADISVVKKSAQVIVKSDLKGIRSNLPEPFVKQADEVMPIRVEKRSGANGLDVITAQLGTLVNARLERGEESGMKAIKQGVIELGSGAGTLRMQDAMRGKNGVWLVGTLPVLSIQGWEWLAGNSGKPGLALQIGGVSLNIGKLVGYGMAVNSLRIDAAKRGDALAMQLASSLLDGEVIWQPHGYETGGKLSARLRNLHWVADEQPSLSDKPGARLPQGMDEKKGDLHPGGLPALEIAIENLQFKSKQIGRFELVGHPEGNDWRMRRLRFTNPDGSLMGEGVWYGSAPSTAKDEAEISPAGIGRDTTQSQINLLLEISDAGKILARSGYPNTVKGGSGKLEANLSWPGSPGKFNYASLNGTLKLDTGKGRFIKMDTGAGKLLSILSLQALPKRITLDFNDVFSEGFQFDNINGKASIKSGVLDTQDFHIDGSSAKVTMKGYVDLNNETQNLQVRILPTVGDSVSLGVAIAAGPVVGIGALIVQKAMGNPLDKLASFEYNVSGTWSDPSVVKVGGTQPKQNNISE